MVMFLVELVLMTLQADWQSYTLRRMSNLKSDALELAADMQMDISIGTDRVKVTTLELALADFWIEERVVDGDKAGATRRAIAKCAELISK